MFFPENVDTNKNSNIDKVQENRLFGVSSSVLPSKLYDSNPDKRMGILITLPSQEDNATFKEILKFNKEKGGNFIDKDLINEMKTQFTRVSYFYKQDIWSALKTDDSGKTKTVPKAGLSYISKRHRSLYQAAWSANPEVKDGWSKMKHNEAVIKPRSLAKVAVVIFENPELTNNSLKANIDYMKRKKFHENFPESSDFKYGKYNIKTGEINLKAPEEFLNSSERKPVRRRNAVKFH